MSLTLQNGIITIIGLASLVVMPLLLWWFTHRARRRKTEDLRSIAAFETLHGLLGRAAESGKVVHLSLGRSTMSGEDAAIAAAGLTVLRYLADQGSSLGISPTVTVADPTLMLVAQDMLYRAYEQKQRVTDYQSTDVNMIATDPGAYAAGAQDLVNQERVAANVMIGRFGQEYLILGEAGAQRGIVQIVGTNTVDLQPLMLATSDHALLGEEVFAAGAYLTHRPEHVASLHVQDALRILIVVAIVIGVLAKTLLG